MCVKSSEPHHRLVLHQPGSIVERLLDTVGLVLHLHNVEMIHPGRFCKHDFLFLDRFNFVLFNLVTQGQLDNLSVLDRIE